MTYDELEEHAAELQFFVNRLLHFISHIPPDVRDEVAAEVIRCEESMPESHCVH